MSPTPFLILVIALISTNSLSQHLFIVNEHASQIEKSAFTVRALGQNYREQNATRALYALRLGYGFTSRWSILVSGSLSNHHDRRLPPDLIGHTHVGNQTHYYTQPIRRGVDYPHLFNGVYVMSRYMIVEDAVGGKPFKLGLYGEWSAVETAHDDAEPDLMNDTGGYGFGLVSTFQKSRFAAGVTSGYIVPNSYFEMQPDHSGGP